MALSNLTTPGVYVQEISTLPSSIVPVATAVPAFIGYTEKGAKNTPTRITSFIEFEAIFGGAFKDSYTVSVGNGNAVSVTTASDSPYILYYHMQMYFGNGGGPCYVISVGTYNYDSPTIVATDFYVPGNSTIGIATAEEVDEVTLLLAPEAAELTSVADIRSIYDTMLAQCDKLKDRFCIFDVNVSSYTAPNPSADAATFRNTYVSANYLNYAAAYYPSLDTILHRRYSDDDVTIDDNRNPPNNIFDTQPNNRLSSVFQGIGTFATILVATGAPANGDILTITVGSTSASFTGHTAIKSVVAAINEHPVISTVARAQISSVASTFYVIVRTGTASPTAITVTGTGNYPASPTNTNGVANSQDTALYNSIKNLIAARVLRLNPSSSMAGIYASVDAERGVWKAPANVSVSNIIGPSIAVTEAQQGPLNVDPTSGKSINVIRAFTGRGTIVWGSRTLDGNSNEWRYVPVRRLFIMAEESIKKATEFVVFEPNDKNTWLRVKSSINNFLTDLWGQGALAGAKPEQAFFIQVGLGETMTAQDILEGKMIIRIGMAAVRPAEFIVLQFMHKLQEA